MEIRAGNAFVPFLLLHFEFPALPTCADLFHENAEGTAIRQLVIPEVLKIRKQLPIAFTMCLKLFPHNRFLSHAPTHGSATLVLISTWFINILATLSS